MGANPALAQPSCHAPSLPPPPSYRDSQDLYAPSSCTYTVIKYEHLLHSKKQIFWWLSPSTIYQLGTHHKKLSELALFQDCYDICTILQKTLRTNIRKSALMVENTKDGFCLKFKSWWIQEERCNSLFASVSQWHHIASTKWAAHDWKFENIILQRAILRFAQKLQITICRSISMGAICRVRYKGSSASIGRAG